MKVGYAEMLTTPYDVIVQDMQYISLLNKVTEAKQKRDAELPQK
jgi:hypothetical protein